LRAVVQRVSRARVAVDGEPVGEIRAGLCVLLGVAEEDGEPEAVRLAGKVAHLRIFENDRGKFHLSLLETGGSALVVSQFMLIADSKRQKGTRPDFSKAAPREQAEPLYELFAQELRDLGAPVQTGAFGAGRARQRRAGHDHPRDVAARPVTAGVAPKAQRRGVGRSAEKEAPGHPMGRAVEARAPWIDDRGHAGEPSSY